MEHMRNWNFNEKPMIVIWEITRACALACKHCRADAMTRRDPRELTFEEGCRLMDQVKELGSPIFVLTGGDPLLRKDFTDLIRYGTSIGLRVSSSPSGTKLVTRGSMQEAADAGLKRVQFSLDGASPETHDAFRQVKGSFQWTLDGLRYAREAGMEVQIGTTVSRYNLHELEQIRQIVEATGCSLWSVFFLVPVGRGQESDTITPTEAEQVLNWLYDVAQTAPFAVKTTEAPFFRRVAHQRTETPPDQRLPLRANMTAAPAPGMMMPGLIASFGINDAKGFVFVDHIGDVHPSGFLPLPAGNVRNEPLVNIYRDSLIFQELRNPELLKGCGLCQYKKICGGSRARAYASHGDYLASDPACVYLPAGAQGRS